MNGLWPPLDIFGFSSFTTLTSWRCPRVAIRKDFGCANEKARSFPSSRGQDRYLSISIWHQAVALRPLWHQYLCRCKMCRPTPPAPWNWKCLHLGEAAVDCWRMATLKLDETSSSAREWKVWKANLNKRKADGLSQSNWSLLNYSLHAPWPYDLDLLPLTGEVSPCIIHLAS